MSSQELLSVPSRARTGGDRVLPVTRLVAGLVVVILIIASALLLLWPDNTEQMFAWTIRPRMTPLVMGAGYLGGAYFFARVVTAQKWHWVALGFLGVTAFAAMLAIATLLHWDRFNHGHVTFWAWVTVYAITPFLVPALWYMNRPADPGTPDAQDVVLSRTIRLGLTVVGIVTLLVSLALFLFPDPMRVSWPWMLTPLTTRVMGAFFVLPGVTAWLLARDGRWSAGRIMVQSAAISLALMLLGVARAWDNFDPANPLTWLYVGGLVGLLLGMVVLYVGVERRARLS